MLSPELTTAKVQRRKLVNLGSLEFRKDVRIDERFPRHLLYATGKWAMASDKKQNMDLPEKQSSCLVYYYTTY